MKKNFKNAKQSTYRTKNVLLVANWRSDVGYAWWLMENFWIRIAEMCANHGIGAYLIYPEIGVIPAAIAKSSIIVEQLEYSDNSLKGLLAIWRYIWTRNIKFIYLTDKPFFNLFYLFLRFAGVRLIVVHNHTLGTQNKPRGLRRLLKQIIARISPLTADRIIAATDYVKQRHIEILCVPSAKSSVAHNGIIPITEEHLQIDMYKEFGIPDEAIVVLTTGRASRYKGIDFIIKCAGVIVKEDRRADVVFLYCGAGPDMEEFQRLAEELKLGNRFIFAGVRSNVREIIRGCDIGFDASHGEVGYSLSILEYMSAGLTTLVPDNPTVCGSIKHKINGLIYTTGDITSACNALRTVIDDPDLRRRLGRNARETVANNFNLATTNAELTGILEGMLR